MAVTQYIGSRYVPLFADPIEWSSSNTYEPLTIVIHEGNSYTSKQAVPKDIDISNEAFWALTGNYNAQVELYRRETALAKATADDAQADIDTLLPKADFSAVNTVKKYVDDSVATVQADIDTLLPKTDFSAENTVKKYVDDSVATVQADIDTLLPKTDFSAENTVKKYVDDENESSFGYYGISIDQTTRKNRLFYYDGRIHTVKKYDWADDSSALFEINDTFYFVGNNHYRYSTDLENWSDEYNIATNPFVTNGKMWAFTLCEHSDGIYCLGAFQYSTDILPNDAGFDSNYFKIMIAPCTVNADKSLDFGNFTELAINTETSSYIDPYMIYNDAFGFVLAVKNEKTTKIEIYTGTNPSNLIRQNGFTNELFGIEAPQLVYDNGTITMFAHAYAPFGTAEVSKLTNRIPDCIIKTQIMTNDAITFTNLWEFVKVDFHARHIGITKSSNNSYNKLKHIGVSESPCYIFYSIKRNVPFYFQVATHDASQEEDILVNIPNIAGIEIRLANQSITNHNLLCWKPVFNNIGYVTLLNTNNVYNNGNRLGSGWYGSLNNSRRVICDPSHTQPAFTQMINCNSSAPTVQSV